MFIILFGISSCNGNPEPKQVLKYRTPKPDFQRLTRAQASPADVGESSGGKSVSARLGLRSFSSSLRSSAWVLILLAGRFRSGTAKP